MDASLPRWDAIIVADAGLPRLGASAEHRSPLRTKLDAVRLAERVAVVGLAVAGHDVRPRASATASAVAVGLHTLRESGSDFTAVVTANLPRLAAALSLLIEELGSTSVDDGLVVAGGTRSQPLLAIYRTRSLRATAAELPRAASPSMRLLVGSLSVRQVNLPEAI